MIAAELKLLEGGDDESSFFRCQLTAGGITRQTIIAIEKRRLIPSVNLALRLAGALGVQLEDVFWLEPGGDSGDEG